MKFLSSFVIILTFCLTSVFCSVLLTTLGDLKNDLRKHRITVDDLTSSGESGESRPEEGTGFRPWGGKRGVHLDKDVDVLIDYNRFKRRNGRRDDADKATYTDLLHVLLLKTLRHSDNTNNENERIYNHPYH